MIAVRNLFLGPTSSVAKQRDHHECRSCETNHLSADGVTEHETSNSDTPSGTSQDETTERVTQITWPESEEFFLRKESTDKAGASHQDDTDTHDWTTTVPSNRTSFSPKISYVGLTYRTEHRKESIPPCNRRRTGSAPPNEKQFDHTPLTTGNASKEKWPQLRTGSFLITTTDFFDKCILMILSIEHVVFTRLKSGRSARRDALHVTTLTLLHRYFDIRLAECFVRLCSIGHPRSSPVESHIAVRQFTAKIRCCRRK